MKTISAGYIFDLKPQGYIVVSANSNLPPIIAYSFTDNLHSDISGNNILIQMIKADLEQRLENFKHLPKNIIENRKATILRI